MSHLIDRLAYTNRLRGLPPQHKLSFGLGLLVLSLLAPAAIQLIIGAWLFWIVVGYAKIPAGLYLKLLALPLGFTLLSLPALMVNVASFAQLPNLQPDLWQNQSWQMGEWVFYISRAGVAQVMQILPRVWATTSCLFFMLLTVPFIEILQVLQQLRCPSLLLDLMQLMYRFIFTLLAIAEELWTAQNARCGYRTYRRSFASLSLLVGQLLQRTLINYRQVSLSMAVRGNVSELRVFLPSTHRASRRYNLEAFVGLTSLTISIFALR
jgi:cobalt/nickel transport system permease protein